MIPTILALLAQAAPAPAPALTAPTLPVCLARPFQDATGATYPFVVAVRPETATLLLAGGFTAAACTAVKRTGAQYRGDVCRMAAMGNTAVQARLEAIYGVAPRLLCSDADALGTALAAALPSAG